MNYPPLQIVSPEMTICNLFHVIPSCLISWYVFDHSLIFVFPSGVFCSIMTISLMDRNFSLFSPSSILAHSSGLLGSASSVPASHACVLLKTLSGSTISCLLSSSPVSWSVRLDSASARPFFFPGRCMLRYCRNVRPTWVRFS